MKKLLAFIMSLGLAFSVVGCSSENVEDTKWIDESAAKIEKEITSGQFVIDGVVYQFPMDLQYWLDNGWHISNKYANVDEFTLEPGGICSEFELFNEDDAYVRVTVMNNSTEDAKVQDCMVSSLYMSLTEVDVVFPQGMSKRNKPDEVIKAYGEPVSRGNEANYVEALYYYETEDLFKCYVELGIHDNDYTINPFSNVYYGILSADQMWESYAETEGVDKACEMYIDAALEASVKGAFDNYVGDGFGTLENAETLYANELNYYAEFLMYYVEIDSNYVTEDQMNRLLEVAKEVLSKTKWEIKGIELDEFEEGTVELAIYPTDFLDVADADLDVALNEFTAKYANADFNTMTDEEYAVVENDYTELLIQAYEKNVSKAGTKDAVTKVYEIDIDNGILSSQAWSEIDEIIMDVLE